MPSCHNCEQGVEEVAQQKCVGKAQVDNLQMTVASEGIVTLFDAALCPVHKVLCERNINQIAVPIKTFLIQIQ